MHFTPVHRVFFFLVTFVFIAHTTTAQFNDSINYMQAQAPYIKEPSWAEIGIKAGMQFAQTYNKMGGFDNITPKLPTWLGGKPAAESFGAQAGRVVSTQLK